MGVEARKASEQIFCRLQDEALTYGLPDRRRATLKRLKLACDAIEVGEAQRIIEEHLGKRLRPLSITSSSIDKYVRASQVADPAWTGPTRSSISAEQKGMAAYVKAREEERLLSSGRKANKAREFSSELEELLREVDSIELRQALRRRIEEGRAAEKRANLLISALRKIPAINVDSLLSIARGGDPQVALSGASSKTLDEPALRALCKLHDRLVDEGNVRHWGMTYENGRLVSVATGAIVASKSELEAFTEAVQLLLWRDKTGRSN